MPSEPKSVRSRVAWGAKWGLIFGSVFTAWAIVLWLVGGSAPFEAAGSSFESVVALYLLGGASAGSAVGLLLPITRRPVGSGVVGAIAAIPVAAFLNIMNVGFEWSVSDVLFVFFFSLVTGIPAGVIYHRIFRGPIDTGQRKSHS